MTDEQVCHDTHADLLNASVKHCIRTMPEFSVSGHTIKVLVPFKSDSDPNVRETYLDLFRPDGEFVRRVRVVFAPDDWLCGGPLDIVDSVERLMRRGLSELLVGNADGGEVSMKSG